MNAQTVRHSISAAFYWPKFVCVLALVGLLGSPLLFVARAQDQDPFPDGPGKQLMLTKCSQCHDTDRIAAQRLTQDGWDSEMSKMIQNGLQLSDQEYGTILNYLATYLGPEGPKINVNKASADDLKTGLGLTDAEAAAIVKYRTDHGDFKDWQGVAGVDGVDPKKIEAKKDSLSFQ
jgi:competence protein ComEA